MAQNKIIVFDTETGGLKPELNPIMELALIVRDVETWEEVSRWESLIKGYGGFKYDQVALDIHGISVSEVENSGISVQEFVGTMIKIFRNFTPKGDRGGSRPILAGHNMGFDISMLKFAFSTVGEDLSKYVLSNNKEICTLDTLPLAKFVWSGKDMSHKLGDCCKRAGLGDFTAHRAMPDVVATCDLIEYFRNRFNMGKSIDSGNPVETKTNKKQRDIIEPNHKVKFQF